MSGLTVRSSDAMRFYSVIRPLNQWLTGFLICALALLPSCIDTDQDGPVNVGVIGEPDGIYKDGLRLSFGAQHLRAATTEGLVALDQTGRILPAIAERWHVSPDGLYYTFKLRDTSWPAGEPITAENIKEILQATVDQLDGTTLGLDLAKLQEIRAMTGRVIELRLSSPMPEFLRLLAQPELGLSKGGAGLGPMVLAPDQDKRRARLNALPPETRGMPASKDWERSARSLTLRAMPSEVAVAKFADGEIDLLLNGSLADLPLVDLGPLSRGTIQVDPAQGVFGLAFLSNEGLFADAGRRAALSMAIDREALIEPFGLGGWSSTSFIVPSALFEDETYTASRWDDVSMERRRSIAAERIANWEGTAGSKAVVRLRLGEGLGNDQIFEQLEQSWLPIGIEVLRVEDGEPADLELRERIARYSSPRWFLNQFNCDLNQGLCSPEADELVRTSLDFRDPVAKERLLAQAHAALVEEEVFIPFGAPVRWALVRGGVTAYEPNQWALHPLFPISQATN